MFESVKALSFRGEAPPQMKNFTAIAQSASFSLPDWVSAYVGLPFKEGGRNRDGLDCYGLLRLVINERFGGAVPEYEGIAYRPGEDRSLLAALMDERIRLWRPIAIGEEKPGDGVLLREDVTSLKERKGQQIGMNEGSVSQFWFNILLTREGMTEKDLQITNMTADDAAAAFIAGITGSYSGVMGLPLHETAVLLRNFGVPLWSV
mgnify:CR=1 FL=1